MSLLATSKKDSRHSRRSHKVKIVVICIIAAIILLIAYVIRLFIVNEGFRGLPKVEFNSGQTATYASTNGGLPIAEGDVEVKVNSFKGFSAEEAENLYGDDDPDEAARLENGGNGELLAVSVSVRNTSTTDKRVLVGSYMLTSGAWENGIDIDFSPALNAGSAKTNLALAPGQEQQVVLPYYAFDYQFSSAFNMLDQRDFNLVLSVQPKLYSIQLGHFDTSS